VTNELEIIQAHTRRSLHGRRFHDGYPEPGTSEYEALAPAEQLAICERRVGIFRDIGDLSTGAVPTVSPRPYDGASSNPIDRW
jgi:hypothetical protein